MSVQTTYLDFSIIFKLGVLVGIFMLSYFYNFFVMILISNKEKRLRKFIIKNKLIQKYEEENKKTKWYE